MTTATGINPFTALWPWRDATGDDALKLQVATWNIAGVTADALADASLLEWLGAASPADVVCVGFQEAEEEGNGDDAKSEALRNVLLTQLNDRAGSVKYAHLATHFMRNVQVHVFIRAHLAVDARVQKGCINTSRAQTSKTASKGAAWVTLALGGPGGKTTLGLACCHLTSHPERLSDRLRDADMILDAFNTECPGVDHLVAFGDFNFRVDLEYAYVEALLANSRSVGQAKRRQMMLDELLAADQLARERAAGRLLPGFLEPPICFEPTYKFKPNVHPRVLVNKRNQTASYCDRVLYRPPPGKGGLTPLSYTAVPTLNLSDHTPVSACFAIPREEEPSTWGLPCRWGSRRRPPPTATAATTTATTAATPATAATTATRGKTGSRALPKTKIPRPRTHRLQVTTVTNPLDERLRQSKVWRRALIFCSLTSVVAAITFAGVYGWALQHQCTSVCDGRTWIFVDADPERHCLALSSTGFVRLSDDPSTCASTCERMYHIASPATSAIHHTGAISVESHVTSRAFIAATDSATDSATDTLDP